MPRMPSAATFKTGKPRGQDEPRPGSLIRQWYDELLAHPGEPIPVVTDKVNTRNPMIQQLRNIYGLDVRLWKRNHHAPSLFVLVGRWDGNHYENYLTQEQLDKLRRDLFMPDREEP